MNDLLDLWRTKIYNNYLKYYILQKVEKIYITHKNDLIENLG